MGASRWRLDIYRRDSPIAESTISGQLRPSGAQRRAKAKAKAKAAAAKAKAAAARPPPPPPIPHSDDSEDSCSSAGA